MMVDKITNHKDLDVYQLSFYAVIDKFNLTKEFPDEERYSLTDQIRRSSRSVAANIAEAWGKRRYKAAFINKLNSAETEASETQVWLDFCRECGYLDSCVCEKLSKTYDHIIGKLVIMMRNPDKWTFDY